jgi:hypothetical protein
VLRPIFIMGLHRSGTTFLYQTLADLLPVAPLTVYHLACYPRIESGHASGTADADKREVDAHFARLGLATRITDGIPLSHATVEEYGWLLQRHAGSVWLTERTAPVFRELCRRLEVTSPGAQAILMKSPWDAGRGPELHRLFPDARFVYLRRDPVAILNSQFRNAVHYGKEYDPFLAMLMEGFTIGRGAIAAQRLLYRVVGEGLYGKVMMRVVARDIVEQVRRMRATFPLMAAGTSLELTYEGLLASPAESLTKICAFLGLEPRKPLDSIKPEPREQKLFPAVEAYRERFLARLAAAGVPAYTGS